MPMRLEWLAEHMHHSDTYAEWIHRQFDYEYADVPLADWQREFAEGQTNGDWPCLIALEGDRLLAGAALARTDLESRPVLGPWLACVFVSPEARGQGLAERLIEGIIREAKRRGEPRLYLHTQNKQDYYAKRGWTPLEGFEAWGKQHTMMGFEL